MPLKPLYQSKPKRLPEVKPVTVCIASICSQEKPLDTIVCVSDTKLSQHHYSEDVATIKLQDVHKDWHVLISGTFGDRRRILEEVSKAVSLFPKVPQSEMEDIFIAAYQNYARRLANEAVLAPYHLTLEEFRKSRNDLGDVLYERIWSEIQRIVVGCDFLVCGFPNDRAAVFSVSNPSVDKPSFITHHGDLGFGVIGSGAFIAESTLYAYRQSFIDPIAPTVYKTLSAKFCAETATDVGETTHMAIFKRDRKFPYDDGLIENIKKIWEKNRPRILTETIDMVNQAVQSTPGTSKAGV